ncbi:MAG: M48 family metalloprotease, partial [Actinomycetota bacterium]
ARVLLLGAAAIGLGVDQLGGRLDDVGPSGQAVVAGATVVAALRGSEAIATRRLATLDGVVPVLGDGPGGGPDDGGSLGRSDPRTRLLGAFRSVAGLAVPLVVLAAIARFVLGPLTDPSWGWPVALGLALAGTAAMIVASRARAARAAPVDEPEAWTDLVERAGARGRVTFGLLVPEGEAGAAPNACAIGAGGRRWVLVDRSLTEEATPAGTFILAHELTHLGRRHPEVQIGLSLLTALAGLVAVPAVAARAWPGELVGLTADDPRSLPVAALTILAAVTVARVPVAWVLRALERSADAGAVDLVGVPDRPTMRTLHLEAGGELAPPRWSQLLAVRPSPAERLEYLARCRRSISPASTPARRPDPDPGLLG